MFQIEVNGIPMPKLHYSLRDAMEAYYEEEKHGCAVMTNIVRV